jgi:hypothetical protein
MLFDGPDHPAWETFDMEGRLEFIEQFGMSQSPDTVDGGGKRIRMWDDRRGGGFPGGEASSLLNFASNDFLDLATDDRVQAAGAEAAWIVGTGASASRVITGDTVAHRRLERDLAGSTAPVTSDTDRCKSVPDRPTSTVDRKTVTTVNFAVFVRRYVSSRDRPPCSQLLRRHRTDMT